MKQSFKGSNRRPFYRDLVKRAVKKGIPTASAGEMYKRMGLTKEQALPYEIGRLTLNERMGKRSGGRMKEKSGERIKKQGVLSHELHPSAIEKMARANIERFFEEE